MNDPAGKARPNMTEQLKSIRLRYYKGRTIYSTLTNRYYANFDTAFQCSKKAGGGACVDFNLWFVHSGGSCEIVY